MAHCFAATVNWGTKPAGFKPMECVAISGLPADISDSGLSRYFAMYSEANPRGDLQPKILVGRLDKDYGSKKYFSIKRITGLAIAETA